MKCSVCLNDFTEPMREIASGPVCASCWYKSEECRLMEERMEQFQDIYAGLDGTPVKIIDIGPVKHLLPTKSNVMNTAWLYKPTTAHPYHFVRVWTEGSVRNRFQDLTFARPDVAKALENYI